MDGSAFVRLVFRACAVVLLVVLPFVWWVGQVPSLVGTLVGAGIGLGNTWVAAWLGRRVLSSPSEVSKGAYGLMLGGKFLVLALVIFVVMRVMGVDAFGILMGFTAVVLSLIIGGFAYTTSAQAEGNGDGLG